MRKAIDVANLKTKHSTFFYALQNLNDKIFVFRQVFYNKRTFFDQYFSEKQKEELKKGVEKERIWIEKQKRKREGGLPSITFDGDYHGSFKKKGTIRRSKFVSIKTPRTSKMPPLLRRTTTNFNRMVSGLNPSSRESLLSESMTEWSKVEKKPNDRSISVINNSGENSAEKLA